MHRLRIFAKIDTSAPIGPPHHLCTEKTICGAKIKLRIEGHAVIRISFGHLRGLIHLRQIRVYHSEHRPTGDLARVNDSIPPLLYDPSLRRIGIDDKRDAVVHHNDSDMRII